jgi:Fe-S-cluster containining protein
MLPVIVIVAGLVMATLLATAAFMFANVIYAGPPRRAAIDRLRRWRPPIARPAELMAWATKVSETVTKRWLARDNSNANPASLAQEVLTGASYAIHHVPLLGIDGESDDCRNRDLCRMGVTAPEVLAIADHLRNNLVEADRIRCMAAENARVLDAAEPEKRSKMFLPCPLLTPNGHCATFAIRPLHCRARCHFPEMDSRQDAKVLEDAARELGEGVEIGLSRGLTAAGLDGHVYEFNSALAAALAMNDASERWAHGEDVFQGCERLDNSLQLN